MKNVTLSADENLIEAARLVAAGRHTTLNDAFRRWLASYVEQDGSLAEANAVLDRTRAYARSSGRYTRDEMNQR